MADTMVGIIGAGQMGSGIAHVFALSGYRVLLNDVAQDRIEAYKYYVLSRDAGFYPLAVEALMDLSAVMSPDELAEAEIRAEQFKPALK